MVRKITFCLITIMLLTVSSAYAAICDVTLPVVPQISYSGTIQVPQNAAVGTALATGQSPVSHNITGFVGTMLVTKLYPSTANSGVKYSDGKIVYNTNLAGVGIAYWSDVDAGQTANNIDLITTVNTGQLYNQGIHSGVLYWALVKTGDIKTGILSGVVSDIVYACLGNTNSVSYSKYLSFANSIQITVTACTVTNTSINVPLGTVNRSTFKGQGTTSTVRSFTLPLQCDGAVKFNLTVSPGSSGALDQNAGIINLDPSESGTKAEGVGIQILYNSNPLVLSSAFNAGASTGAGTYNIDLGARYYQSGSTVTPGLANGTATFTVQYN